MEEAGESSRTRFLRKKSAKDAARSSSAAVNDHSTLVIVIQVIERKLAHGELPKSHIVPAVEWRADQPPHERLCLPSSVRSSETSSLQRRSHCRHLLPRLIGSCSEDVQPPSETAVRYCSQYIDRCE